MSKFLLITKINIQRSFNSIKVGDSKKKKGKNSIKVFIVGLIVLYLLWYIYYLTREFMPFFISIGKPLYLIAFLFTMCSIYIFFFNIFRIKSVLFDFKDYDLLMSLPLKKNTIIASKMVSLYLINILYTFIIMIPGYIGYIQFANMPNDLLFFILLFLIPIIPILLSTIVGIILSWLTSFFKNKKIGSYVVNYLLIFIVLSIAFKTNDVNEIEIVNQSVNLVDNFGRYYPFATIFVDLLSNFTIINLLIYLFVPIILSILFMIFINKGYITLRAKLMKEIVKNDYKIKRYKSFSALKSMYRKEIKKYFSTPLYVINTSFGCVVMLFLILSMCLFNDYMISRFERILNMNETIKSNIFLIFSMICVLSSTTNSSISLEGKSLWIMKMIPVSTDKKFLSKIMVNLTILVPTIIIGGTFFGIYLHLSLMDFILLYLLPFAYSLFASCSGLLINLIFPKIDFDSEIKVIKQSMSVFLSILVGVIVVIIPFRLFNINTRGIFLITSIIFLIDFIIMLILHYYGNKKFERL